MDEGDDKKGDWIEAELRDIALLSGEVKDGIMPMLPSFEKVEGLGYIEKFLFFLNSKREKLAELCEGIEYMNKILDEQETTDTNIWFKIEFHVDLITQNLCFRIMRREVHNYGNTKTSFVVLCQYTLRFLRISELKYQWYIEDGDLRTFGQVPQQGRWENKNSRENFYSEKGLGKLLWNIVVWAASLLEMNRWEICARPQTQRWFAEYYDNMTKNSYKVYRRNAWKNRVMFIASPDLTKYAHGLVMEGLKKIGELKMLEKLD